MRRPNPRRLAAPALLLVLLSVRAGVVESLLPPPSFLSATSPSSASFRCLSEAAAPRRSTAAPALRVAAALELDSGGAAKSSEGITGGAMPPMRSREGGGRRSFLSSAAISAVALAASLLPAPASAAPPIAVISEQLGYFPVTSSSGETLYVPSRARRSSSDQSVDLAKHLHRSGVVMYGAYWCPHCRNQKEMFGKEAWALINYVECAPRGYGADPALCLKNGVEGYPEWNFGNGKRGNGEMTLERIAKMSGYRGKFDASLEEPLPASSGSCR